MSGEGRETRLVLIGMMGAGKTSIGQALAERLGWPFTDTDDEIVACTGSSIPELFARDGEPAFRQVESEVVTRTLALPGPRVIAVGGGAVVNAANRAGLRDRATVVWLRARVTTLAARVGGGDGRPMLRPSPGAGSAPGSAGSAPGSAGCAPGSGAGPGSALASEGSGFASGSGAGPASGSSGSAPAVAALERLLTERAPLYEATASFVVDVDDSSLEEVVDRVAAGLAASAGTRHA